MIAAIHQPEHLPWFGYFHKIVHSDRFVLLDTVQFKKNYFENRNRIMTRNGPSWLTVPVKMKGHINKVFYQMEIDSHRPWKRKYLKTLAFNYRKGPFFHDVEPLIQMLEKSETKFLADLNISIIEKLCEILDIQANFIRAKDLKSRGKGDDLLVSILEEIGADRYLMGKSGYDYIDPDKFSSAKIEIVEHRFVFPQYENFMIGKTPEIVPSIVDMIASIGAKHTKKMLESTR